MKDVMSPIRHDEIRVVIRDDKGNVFHKDWKATADHKDAIHWTIQHGDLPHRLAGKIKTIEVMSGSHP
jgi:hypothetical protein